MGAQVEQAKAAPRVRTRLDVMVLLPFILFVVAYFLIPRFAPNKTISTLIYIGIYVLLALGLNLLLGYAGQISLGHAAFYGIGAYTSAILTLQPIQAGIIPSFSSGLGIMAACAALMSLTRVSGWKLVAGIGGLFLLSWASRAMHAGFPVALVMHAVGMAILGLVLRIVWWKTAISGVVSVVVGVVCAKFLGGVLQNSGTSPWIGMLAGIIIAGLIAYLVGAQVLRLKGHYLAMATLGFGIIVEIVFSKWVSVTGGSSDGIYGIPSIAFVDGLPRPLRQVFEIARGGNVSPEQQYYYLVWMFVLIALVLATNIVRSRVGRAFRAVHGSQQAAESLGVDTERYKVQVFVLAAALASVAGSLHAHNCGIGYINPKEFSFEVSVQILVIVVIGGLANVWGALIGAAVIQLLKNWILTLDQANVSLFGLTLKGLDPIVYGAILMGVMILLPQGIVKGLADTISGAVRGARSIAHRKAG